MKPRRNEEAQAHIGLSSHTKKKLQALGINSFLTGGLDMKYRTIVATADGGT
jgi:hypothetical protein